MRVPVHIAVQELQENYFVDITTLAKLYGNRVTHSRGSTSITLVVEKINLREVPTLDSFKIEPMQVGMT